jgi:D-threonine aldolase
MHSHKLHNPDAVPSPALLFYPAVIKQNIAAAVQHVGNPKRLRPHVKTHKCPQIVAMQLAAGVTKHKCATIAEAEMLAIAGAPDVLLAYPLVGPNITRFFQLQQKYPATTFSAVVDHPSMIAPLAAAPVPTDVYIDVNMGMDRTGAAFDLLEELSTTVVNTKPLRLAGWHCYDGHINHENPDEREVAIRERLNLLLDMRASVELTVPVPELICGGTPGFPVYARLRDVPGLICSPGTYVLHDHGYGSKYPDFTGLQPAALMLTRVVSRPRRNRVTFDLGNKSVAADPLLAKRVHLLDAPPHTPVVHSEEHYTIETDEDDRYQPGDVAYAVPGHICPSVALHRWAVIVEDGDVVGKWEIIARERDLASR